MNCKQCLKPFERFNSMQSVCVPCLAKIGPRKRKEARTERKATKDKIKALKPRSKWMQEAQQAFNAWIRARDLAKGYGCISCGTKNGKENAGHFFSVGARPELRFDEENVYLQCERCNTYLHGNLLAYRVALIERRGPAVVEYLEGPHEAKKYAVTDLQDIISKYRCRLKEMRS